MISLSSVNAQLLVGATPGCAWKTSCPGGQGPGPGRPPAPEALTSQLGQHLVQPGGQTATGLNQVLAALHNGQVRTLLMCQGRELLPVPHGNDPRG
ncbi:hypothetical protein DFAR_1660004 [Desulfarculales bacterium]